MLQPGHRLPVDVSASNLPKGLLLVDSRLEPQRDPDAPSFANVPVAGHPAW